MRVPSGSTRGTRKQDRPAGRLGEGQEQVGHRRGGEPLVAGEPVAAVRLRRSARRGVRADVGAALLLGHRHAGDQAALAERRPQAGVVAGRWSAAARTARRGRASWRSAGTTAYVIEIGHRWPASAWAPGENLAARATCAPGRSSRHGAPCSPCVDRGRHQLVVVREVVDLVDPVAVPVVGAQDGRVLVGEPALLLRLLAAGQRAELAHLVLGPAGALAVQALEQGRVVGSVVTDERRRLVGDLVGGHRLATPS